MDPEFGLELTSRQRPSASPERRFERTDSAADRLRNPANSPDSLAPDTVSVMGTPVPPAVGHPKSRWAKIGVAAKYIAVAGAAIGIDHAGIAISNSRHVVPKPQFDTPPYTPPSAQPYAPQTEPTYVRYGNLNIHSNLTDAFHQSLGEMYKSRKMNETLAYLHEAPLHWLGLELTINPALHVDEVNAMIDDDSRPFAPNSYDPDAHSITWNPNAKFYTVRESADNEVTSPTTGLITQLHNAKDALQNLPAYYVRSGLSHPDFWNLQEKSAIDQTNAVNKEIGTGQVEQVDLEHYGFPEVTNSTLDTSLPDYLEAANQNSSTQANSTTEIEHVRDTNTDENEDATRPNALQATRARVLQSSRSTQADFFKNIEEFEAGIGSERNSYFLNSFNQTNMESIEHLMRDGEAIILEVEKVASGANYGLPAMNATVESRLKNYTEVAEEFAKRLYDNSGDSYVAKVRNGTSEYLLTPDMDENEINATAPFQMGAAANATRNRLQSQASGSVGAQIAALRSASNH